MRRLLRSLLLRAARTGPGKRAIASVIVADPELASRPMRMATATRSRFADVESWPERLDGFEDLAFLFTSSPLNAGVVSMTIAEAAYLYRLVHGLGRATVAEIGRFQGGSTLIIASALAPGSRLFSYDTHVRRMPDYTGAEMDKAVRETLRRYGLADRVELLVEDSTHAIPPGPCDLVFVDGDHTYAGVRADYDHWRAHVKSGGHLLLHDAVCRGVLTTGEESVVQLVAEITRDDAADWEPRAGADSLAHFVRRCTDAS